MNNILGEVTKYILVQENTVNGTYQPMFYNEPAMSLSPTTIDRASKFDDLATVQAVANVQDQMAVIFQRPLKHKVVREDVIRTEVK